MNLDKYQAIIFDLDGTLVNSMVAHASAWEQTCGKFNIPYEKEWLNQLGGMPSRKVTLEILARYQLDIEPSLITSDKIANFERIEHKGEIIPDIYQILQQNYQRKKVGIGTGAQYKHAKEILDTTDIMDMVSVLVTSDDVENHKPHPDTFSAVANALKVSPNQCVVFEDTIIGRQAANSAGMDCFMVSEGNVGAFFPSTIDIPDKYIHSSLQVGIVNT